jgi:hypothetical protein
MVEKLKKFRLETIWWISFNSNHHNSFWIWWIWRWL